MSPHPAPASAHRAGPREWTGLAVLTLPLLLLALDISVLYLAAPHLSADLRPSATQSLWIMDIYGFLIAGFLVTMGTLGDRIGRRRLLLAGGFTFAVASVLTAYAVNAEMLIASRALLGIAGATLMPSTLALISTMFRDDRQRSFAIALWMTTMSVGVAVGPLVGGVMLEHFWWGSVFLLAVPVMAVLIVAGPFLLPEFRNPASGRLDLPSILLSLAALLPLVYALKHTAAHGPGVNAALALAAGLVAGRFFVRRQLRLPDPMLDMSLFANRAFSASLALLMFGLLAINGLEYLNPQFLQMVAGMTPLKAGVYMLPIVLAATAGSLAAPFLARRFGHAHVMASGALLAVAGLVLVTRADSSGGVPALVIGSGVAILGISPMPVLTTDLVVASAPQEKAGSAAALSETSGELGVGLGVAVAGSIVAAVYGPRIEELPGAPGAAAEDLASAVSAAGELPAAAAGELLATARDAFT
ncbi:MFS transporter, partial [Streptomyces sp. NPDC055078]